MPKIFLDEQVRQAMVPRIYNLKSDLGFIFELFTQGSHFSLTFKTQNLHHWVVHNKFTQVGLQPWKIWGLFTISGFVHIRFSHFHHFGIIKNSTIDMPILILLGTLHTEFNRALLHCFWRCLHKFSSFLDPKSQTAQNRRGNWF